MGKGGGSQDTSGIEKANAQATALQREIYDQTREDIQPWYTAGANSMGKLADFMGIEGGSNKSREDIYSQLMPEYTSQQTTIADQNLYTGMDGSLHKSEDDARGSYDFNPFEMTGTKAPNEISKYTTNATKDVVDYDALNAAVEEQLGSQGTPEGYGSLLERFDMSKFEADPGYQFRQDEAQKAMERSMAAQGNTMGGAGYGSINPQVARSLEQQSQGLASQEYGSAYDRYNIDQTNTYNRLAGIAGMGQASTGQLSGAGQNYATNTGNLQTGLASAQMNAQNAGGGSNVMGGAMGGAAAGASFGPWGALAGGVLGGIAGS